MGDIDLSAVPNELAYSLAAECRKWTYASYYDENDGNDVPRNPHVDKQYETRLDRAITDIQAKIASQKRALSDVPACLTTLTTAAQEIRR